MMAARRPRARPCPSWRVTTALPILMTRRLAEASSSRRRKGALLLLYVWVNKDDVIQRQRKRNRCIDKIERENRGIIEIKYS